MRKAFIIAAVLLTISTIASAQLWVYQSNYYSNRNNGSGIDQHTYIVNPGTRGTPLSQTEGAVCADIYVFDATQEMIECCSCTVTANGMRTLSLLNDLTQDPLTGFPAPNSGVIAIISDDQVRCDPTNPQPVYGLLGWQTHLQQPVSGTYVLSEDGFQGSILTTDRGSELAFLGQACSFVQYLGSGKGVCTCGLKIVG